ncbi:MAG: SDR family NAD(P)-dependent oxidoreductase [Myxococcota bacterium]
MAGIELSPTTGVVVTGGASGIGLACARALAEAGRGVALWDLDAATTERAAREIAEATGVAAIGLAVDVRAPERFPAALDASRAALGTLGGLVHSAGVVQTVPVDELDAASWHAVVDVNLTACALLVRAMASDLRANAGSAIVAIASLDALVGNAAIPAYCASKAGLLGLVRSVADRFADDGVRANCVCPGYIETPMMAGPLSTPEQRAYFERQIPLGRLGEPREIATVVRFLMSDEARYVTGAELSVDGGVFRTQR